MNQSLDLQAQTLAITATLADSAAAPMFIEGEFDEEKINQVKTECFERLLADGWAVTEEAVAQQFCEVLDSHCALYREHENRDDEAARAVFYLVGHTKEERDWKAYAQLVEAKKATVTA